MARSRARVYSPFRPQLTPEVDEDGSVLQSTDNLSLRKSLAGSQLDAAINGATKSTKSPSPSIYTIASSSAANAKADAGRLLSSNSLLSASLPPRSRSISRTPSHRSVMSQDGYSVRTRTFTRLGVREHRWGQIEPQSPFLCSGEPFANAKLDGRLVPLSSGGRSPSCQTVALGEGRSVRTASPVPSRNTVVCLHCQMTANGLFTNKGPGLSTLHR